MTGTFPRSWRLLIVGLGVCLLASTSPNAHAQNKSKKTKKTAAQQKADASAEPDKILYNRALDDIKRGRYTEGRLALQTLINTYPDSEYLAKAKLSIADSYYKEGGTSNLMQSIAEYKDFGTFFPFLDEAAYAQMQVGMAHYKMTEKSDRDTTQAEAAEDEFQAFLLKYPQSSYAPQAEQRLREVQEILADGQYRIAHYYYSKPDTDPYHFQAAAARLMDLTERYPLYSQSDEALWMLGDIYQRAKKSSPNEDTRNHWTDLAAKCYNRIVQDYPLSKRASESKARLTAMGMPVPPPDPTAIARMQEQQKYEHSHHPSIFAKSNPLLLIKSAPDVHSAAHYGLPNLNPPTDAIAASDVLKPNAPGPVFDISASPPANSSTEGEPTTPVDATPVKGPPASDQPTTTIGGVEIISTGGASASPANPAAAPNPQPVENPPAVTPAPSTLSSANPAAPAVVTNSSPTATQPGTETPGGSSNSSSQPAANGTGQANGQANGQQTAQPADPKDESSSKKKKGLRKIIPW